MFAKPRFSQEKFVLHDKMTVRSFFSRSSIVLWWYVHRLRYIHTAAHNVISTMVDQILVILVTKVVFISFFKIPSSGSNTSILGD